MKPLYFILASFLSFTACSSNTGIAEKQASESIEPIQNGSSTALKTIRSAEAKTLVTEKNELVIIDVRTPEEYAAGHLKNSVLINRHDPDFNARIKSLDKNKDYLVYCAKGGRSGETTSMMQKFGFTKIYDATEGFESLKNAGVPVE